MQTRYTKLAAAVGLVFIQQPLRSFESTKKAVYFFFFKFSASHNVVGKVRNFGTLIAASAHI